MIRLALAAAAITLPLFAGCAGDGSHRTLQLGTENLDRSERINEGISPYRRFVVTQQEKLDEARSELVSIESALLRLREKIEKL